MWLKTLMQQKKEKKKKTLMWWRNRYSDGRVVTVSAEQKDVFHWHSKVIHAEADLLNDLTVMAFLRVIYVVTVLSLLTKGKNDFKLPGPLSEFMFLFCPLLTVRRQDTTVKGPPAPAASPRVHV